MLPMSQHQAISPLKKLVANRGSSEIIFTEDSTAYQGAYEREQEGMILGGDSLDMKTIT
jgi:hypothetical protein